MILPDTSIWVDQQRGLAPHLNDLLNQDWVVIHPLIVGELACGFLANRAKFLAFLQNLQSVATARDEEVLLLIESRSMYGKGIGYIDAHLLASVVMSGDRLWTHDKRLARVATDLGIGYTP